MTAPIWPMYRAMVGVGLVCALAVVGAYEGTKPFIAANEAQARQAAVLRVIPGAVRSEPFVATDGSFARGSDGEVVYAAYDDRDALVGLAFEGRANGYQDAVVLLVGYRVGAQQLSGIAVTASRETPGLGDRIEHDHAFLAQFDALPVPLSPDGHALAEPIAIDTISGATISSSAVARAVDQAAHTWVPRLAAHRADFTAEAR